MFIANIIPLVLLIERDIWPNLLYNPTHRQTRLARNGACVYIRLALMVACFLSYLVTPRVWYRVDPYAEDEVSPEQTASPFSYLMSYYWIEYLVYRAFRHNIEIKDLPNVPDYDRGKLWTIKLKNNDRGSSMKTLISVMRYDLMFMVSAAFMMGVVSFVSPLSMQRLLAHIEGSSKPFISPWIFVVGLGMGPLLYSWCCRWNDTLVSSFISWLT